MGIDTVQVCAGRTDHLVSLGSGDQCRHVIDHRQPGHDCGLQTNTWLIMAGAQGSQRSPAPRLASAGQAAELTRKDLELEHFGLNLKCLYEI